MQIIAIAIIIGFSFAAWIQDYVNIGYGKHLSNFIPITIPPRIGWVLYELPNILWILYYLKDLEYGINMIPFALFTIHYINRDLVYPFRISKFSKRIPIEVVASAFLYTTCNGYLQTTTHVHSYENNNYFRIILGICIFFYGMISNIQCDNILRSLKKENSNEYKIPTGNLFNLVSSGHYLAEIIEWFGYYLVSNQFSGFLFFIATLSILSARAVSTHKWYKNKFKEYPAHRTAIIPYLL